VDALAIFFKLRHYFKILSPFWTLHCIAEMYIRANTEHFSLSGKSDQLNGSSAIQLNPVYYMVRPTRAHPRFDQQLALRD
jgi:hypothetical protein